MTLVVASLAQDLNLSVTPKTAIMVQLTSCVTLTSFCVQPHISRKAAARDIVSTSVTGLCARGFHQTLAHGLSRFSSARNFELWRAALIT